MNRRKIINKVKQNFESFTKYPQGVNYTKTLMKEEVDDVVTLIEIAEELIEENENHIPRLN